MTVREYITNKDFVLEKLTQRELLEGLAEEASELSQAALKMIRATDSANVTPVSEQEALYRLHEEVNDVILMLDALDIKWTDSCENTRWTRWAKRLKEAELHDND